MTDNSAHHMTAKYKVMITAGVAKLIPEADTKPQNASNIHLCLIRACLYGVSI